MNKKKLLGFITSLSLIGGLTGTGQVFAATNTICRKKNITRNQVKRTENYEKMIEDCVERLAALYDQNDNILPVLDIDKDGNITVRKSKWRLGAEGEKKTKVGERYVLNKGLLKNWWKKDFSIVLKNVYKNLGDRTAKLRKSWDPNGELNKIADVVESLGGIMEKNLLEKAVEKYIDTRWEEHLEALQDQISQKREEAEEIREKKIAEKEMAKYDDEDY